MPHTPELPVRPEPPRTLGSVLTEWINWFGTGRLVASAISVIVVVVGATWLLRAPTAAVESTLVASSGAPPAATLTPPTLAPLTSAPSDVVVHVAGAVVSPGVYTLDVGMRVGDAVSAAGGSTPDADLDALNLAAVVSDGQRVYVPRHGEIDPASVLPSTGNQSGPGASLPTGPLDINTASAEQLEALPGVGPSLAAAIVDDRTRNGPFSTVDDLDRVSGIGTSKLEALRGQVTV